MDYTGQIIFLGIDVHKRTYSVTAVCGGVILKRNTLAASPEVLLKYLKNAFKGATMKSAYEAGFSGFVLHRFLIENGIENIVIHAANLEVESNNRKKTDKRDSEKIAVQLSAGRLKGIFVPSVEMENRRFISRLRESFVKQRTRVAIQIKSFLNLNGLINYNESPKTSNLFLLKILSQTLSEEVRYFLVKLSHFWIYISNQIKEIDKKLEILTPKEQEIFKQYRKITGFGPKIATILTLELGDTSQFSSEDKLFSFCGLTPSEHTSGDHKRLGHITRQGNPILRKILVQAAWVAVRKDPYFSEYYKKLSSKVGACRAIIAVARKLIGRGRCVMKKKDNYLAVKADKVVLQEN